MKAARPCFEESLYSKPCRYRRALRQPRPMASPFDTGASRRAWPIFQARRHQIEPKTPSTGIQESQSIDSGIRARNPRHRSTPMVLNWQLERVPAPHPMETLPIPKRFDLSGTPELLVFPPLVRARTKRLPQHVDQQRAAS